MSTAGAPVISTVPPVMAPAIPQLAASM